MCGVVDSVGGVVVDDDDDVIHLLMVYDIGTFQSECTVNVVDRFVAREWGRAAVFEQADGVSVQQQQTMVHASVERHYVALCAAVCGRCGSRRVALVPDSGRRRRCDVRRISLRRRRSTSHCRHTLYLYCFCFYISNVLLRFF